MFGVYVAGVDNVRVGRGSQRGDRSRAVEPVALFHLFGQAVRVNVRTGSFELRTTPRDSRGNRGSEIDLYRRVRQDNGADVPSRHDDGTLLRNVALNSNHFQAHLGMRGNGGNDSGDFVGEQIGFVQLAPSGDDTKAKRSRLVELHFYRRDLHESRERRAVVYIYTVRRASEASARYIAPVSR